MVEVALVVVALVAVRFVAVRVVMVADTAVRSVSIIELVKRPRVAKRFVEVAFPAMSEDE